MAVENTLLWVGGAGEADFEAWCDCAGVGPADTAGVTPDGVGAEGAGAGALDVVVVDGFDPPMLSVIVGGGAGASVGWARSIGAGGGGCPAPCWGRTNGRPGTNSKAPAFNLLIVCADQSDRTEVTSQRGATNICGYYFQSRDRRSNIFRVMVAQLHNILLAGSNLLQLESAAGEARNLESVLNARLENFYASLNKNRPLPVPNAIQDLHLETAQCALELIEQAHRLLDDQLQGRAHDDASIGSRDLAQLRTLLTMVFRWGVSPLLTRISGTWSSNLAFRIGPRDIEPTAVPEDYRSLSSLLMRLAAILLPHGAHGRLSQTLVTTSILERHMLDFLKASMALGWLPKSLTSESARAVDALRPIVLRLLELCVDMIEGRKIAPYVVMKYAVVPDNR